MQWYRWFSGDYLRDTIHLSWDEDLAYRRLLDLCYNNGGHITRNHKLLYRHVRADTPEQMAAVESVLAQYFKKRGKTYYNSRASEELLEAKCFHDARVRGGKERAKRAARAQLSSSSAQPSTSTSTSTEESPNSTLSQVQGLGVPLSLWAQYRKLRERLHRPIIAGAEDHIIAELIQFQAAGEIPTEILTRAVRTSSWKLSPNGEHKGESENEKRQRRTAEAAERLLQKAGPEKPRKARGALPH